MLWLGERPLGFQLWKAFQKIYFIFTKREFNRLSSCFFSENKYNQIFPAQRYQVVLRKSGKESKICFLMDVTNLAQSYWTSVSCRNKLLGDVVCQGHFGSEQESTTVLPQSNICSPQQVLNHTSCFSVVWTNETLCKFNYSGIAPRMMTTSSSDFEQKYLFLLEASSFHLTPLLVQESHFLVALNYDKVLQKYRSHDLENISSQILGFKIVQTNSFVPHPGNMTFHCADNIFVSVHFVCNGQSDCPNDDADEQFCNCSQHVVEYPRYFENFGRCEPLIQIGLKNNLSESMTIKSEANSLPLHSEEFHCHDGTVIHISLVDDLVADCATVGEDEKILNYLALAVHFRNCADQNMIPCTSGHPMCFNIFQLCSYSLNSNGHLTPCRNGGHLYSCADFECNLKFKCPGSYCIPWNSVCDGKTDCPDFHDESEMCQRTVWCTYMYKCHKVKDCIRVGSVCDGNQDCPLGDDEFLCQLRTVSCPEVCNCIVLTIVCFSTTNIIFRKQSYPHVYVSLQSTATMALSLLHVFQELIFLVVRNTCITSICHHTSAQHIIFLSVTFTPFAVVEHRCFQHQRKITVLNLTNDNIHTLEEGSLADLVELTFLNLSHNKIKVMGDIMHCETGVKMLSLFGNIISIEGIGGLQHLKVSNIETFQYSLCCVVPHDVHCNVPHPWYTSCSALLLDHTKFIFIFCSFVSTGSTVIVLVHQRYKRNKGRTANNSCYNFVVVTICADQGLFEVFLFGLWNVCVSYKDVFVEYEATWRASSACFILNSVWSFHSSTAPALVFYLSLSRLFVVKFPIETKFKQLSFCQRCVLVILLICFCFAVFVLIHSWFFHRIIPNVLCFPFIDPTHSYSMVKILAFFSGCFQMSICLLVLVTNVQLVVILRKRQRKIKRHCSKVYRGKTIQNQLAVLSITNIICYFTSNTIFLSSHFVEEFSMDMTALTLALCETTNMVVTNCIYFATACGLLTNQEGSLRLEPPRSINVKPSTGAVMNLVVQTNI